jgi:hypothetical protein
MSPSLVLVGLKATLSCPVATGSIGAGASLLLPANRVIVMMSVSGSIDFEALREDGSTWESIENVASERIDAQTNNHPTVGYSVTTDGTNVRLRNTTGGTLDYKYWYWELI